MRVCFLVGSMDISGGTYVILQHADYLRKAGYDITLGIQFPFDQNTIKWHPTAEYLTLLPIEEAKERRFDIVIATWWKTALELHHFKSTYYAYFVQSIESRFYDKKEKQLKKLVEETYTLPLNFITEAVWIKDYLYSKYRHSVALVKNGVRKDLYKPEGDMIEPRLGSGKLRVLVEGPFGVSFKNTGKTIKTIKKAKPEEIWVLTSSNVTYLPGVDKVFSRVSVLETSKIYRSCDVIVKLSYVEGMFGPPLEQFHCGGTAIVYEVTGHDEYIRHGINGFVAEKGNKKAVIEYLETLIKNPSLLKEMKKQALATAEAWPSWEQSSHSFMKWIEEIKHGGKKTNVKDLQKKIEFIFSEYVEQDQQYIKKRPWLQLKLWLRRCFNLLPKSISEKIRKFKYILECL